MKKILYTLLLGSLVWISQLQAQVVLHALEGGEDSKAIIQDVVIEKLSFHTTQGKITTQNITIPYTNGMGSFSGINLSEQLTNGENNDTNTATLSISSGQFSNSGNITARLTIDGDGEYLVKKNDNGDIIDFAVFNIDLSSTTFRIILRSKGGWKANASHSDSNWFTRNNCGYNYDGEDVYYTGTAYGEGYSTTSYSNALSIAQNNAYNKFLEQGQAYANYNGSCTYNPPAPPKRYYLRIAPYYITYTATAQGRQFDGEIKTAYYSTTRQYSTAWREVSYDQYIKGSIWDAGYAEYHTGDQIQSTDEVAKQRVRNQFVCKETLAYWQQFCSHGGGDGPDGTRPPHRKCPHPDCAPYHQRATIGIVDYTINDNPIVEKKIE